MKNVVYWSILPISLLLICSQNFKKSFIRDIEKKLIQENVNLNNYDYIFLMHFDYCAPDSKCGDTLKIVEFIEKPKGKKMLLIDTQYNSIIPKYINTNNIEVKFISREIMQRRGIHLDFQRKLIIKGNKLRKICVLK